MAAQHGPQCGPCPTARTKRPFWLPGVQPKRASAINAPQAASAGRGRALAGSGLKKARAQQVRKCGPLLFLNRPCAHLCSVVLACARPPVGWWGRARSGFEPPRLRRGAGGPWARSAPFLVNTAAGAVGPVFQSARCGLAHPVRQRKANKGGQPPLPHPTPPASHRACALPLSPPVRGQGACPLRSKGQSLRSGP